MNLKEMIESNTPVYYLPERDNNKKILLLLMQTQNDFVQYHTKIPLYDKNIELDVKKNWSEKLCHKAVALISAKVINTFFCNTTPLDTSILPYCVINTKCSHCLYAATFGKCTNPDSNYQNIIRKIYETHGKTSIASIMEFDVLLFNIWLGT